MSGTVRVGAAFLGFVATHYQCMRSKIDLGGVEEVSQLEKDPELAEVYWIEAIRFGYWCLTRNQECSNGEKGGGNCSKWCSLEFFMSSI